MNERIGLANTAGERGNNRCMKLISRGTVYCRVGSSSPYQFTDAVVVPVSGLMLAAPCIFSGFIRKMPDCGFRHSGQ
jgi:hypothetical protein